jgi:hypothetical protein
VSASVESISGELTDKWALEDDRPPMALRRVYFITSPCWIFSMHAGQMP